MRAAPRLVFVLPLEQPGTVMLDAASFEDEQRLRCFLRRARAVVDLPFALEQLLNDLDEHDRESSA